MLRVAVLAYWVPVEKRRSNEGLPDGPAPERGAPAWSRPRARPHHRSARSRPARTHSLASIAARRDLTVSPCRPPHPSAGRGPVRACALHRFARSASDSRVPAGPSTTRCSASNAGGAEVAAQLLSQFTRLLVRHRPRGRVRLPPLAVGSPSGASRRAGDRDRRYAPAGSSRHRAIARLDDFRAPRRVTGARWSMCARLSGGAHERPAPSHGARRSSWARARWRGSGHRRRLDLVIATRLALLDSPLSRWSGPGCLPVVETKSGLALDRLLADGPGCAWRSGSEVDEPALHAAPSSRPRDGREAGSCSG